MRIGIDLDGVVLDTEKQFRNDAELYDILVLNKNSMKDPTELRVQERYDWNEQEVETFVKSYFLEATKKSHIMPGAKEVIELLKKDGHELIVITARGMDTPLMRKLGEKMLDEAGIKFDKYYWGKKEKVEIAKKENIDIMIEDSLRNCMKFSEAGIKSIYLKDSNLKSANDSNIKECYIWAEIYRYIRSLCVKKIKNK